MVSSENHHTHAAKLSRANNTAGADARGESPTTRAYLSLAFLVACLPNAFLAARNSGHGIAPKAESKAARKIVTSTPGSHRKARTPGSLCIYTGKRVTLFTAGGNGNWGDNMQPWTWANLFSDRGVPPEALASASCDTCLHDYPWIDEATRRKLPKANVTSSGALEGTDVLWIGGGGLFGYPHGPLSHNEGGWQEWAVDERGIVIVFAAVGSTANAHGLGLIRRARKLVDGASFVSGRGPIEEYAFREALGLAVPVMPDPILSDHVTYPTQLHSDPLRGRPLCWIFRSEDAAFLERVSHLVNNGDILYTMEGKDGDYHGLFPQAVMKQLNQGTDFFGSISSTCKMVISQRYHGVIMGLRSAIPVIGLYEYHPHKVSDVMELIGEPECMAHISNFTWEVAPNLIRYCFTSFDADRRDRQLAKIEATFHQMFDTALKAAGICS